MHPDRCTPPLSKRAPGWPVFIPFAQNKSRRLRQHRQHRRGRGGPVPSRARSHQPRQTGLSTVGAGGAGAACAEPDPLLPMLLTVLTVFSTVACILMTLFLARPSRLNVMSMPNARRARGGGGQRVRYPISQELRSAMISRTHAATGSASIMHSIAPLATRKASFDQIEPARCALSQFPTCGLARCHWPPA
jgi:hypothetical protein